ncbi:MAG: ZIP family metal transporter [Burkholderiaceae bacterium]|nr:ZIP family metal transporter [Burkholderiaceae bacterium]MDO7670273.1 ZIP family metal transporter [Burkholderiaceae bacterium]
MALIWILAGTVIAGVGSVWIAAMLSFGIMARLTKHMLSFAAGALLSTALLQLLPEALAAGISADALFAFLLAGVVFFFILDKAELYHHGHEHGEQGLDLDTLGDPGAGHGQASSAHAHSHAHAHTHAHGTTGSGGWAVLVGDSVHAFGDGILIASAFMADWRLGMLASLAVLAHEVPHHMGDLVVLRHVAGNARSALVKVSLAGTVTALGGVAGYFLLAQFGAYLPYFLVIAASSFIYVALADLIPQLQRQASLRDSVGQLTWLILGIGLVFLVGALAHSGHGH